MHHNVCTQRKGLNQERGGKRVVHHRDGAGLVGDLCASPQVGNRKQWVPQGFDVQQRRPPAGPGDSVQVGGINELDRTLSGLGQVAEKLASAGVGIAGSYDSTPDSAALDNGRDGCHSRTKDQRPISLLQVGEHAFETLPVLVVVSAVGVAIAVAMSKNSGHGQGRNKGPAVALRADVRVHHPRCLADPARIRKRGAQTGSVRHWNLGAEQYLTRHPSVSFIHHLASHPGRPPAVIQGSEDLLGSLDLLRARGEGTVDRIQLGRVDHPLAFIAELDRTSGGAFEQRDVGNV